MNYVDCLQIAAECEVDEQRQSAPVQGTQKGSHGCDQFYADAEILHEGRPGKDNQHQKRCQNARQEQSIDQGPSRVRQILPPESLSHERVHAQQQAATEDGDAVIKTLAQASSTD